MDSLRWLGLDWDEGPEVGARTARTCSPSGWTSTPTWSRSCWRPARRTAATARARSSRSRETARPRRCTAGYDGHCRDLTAEQGCRPARRGPAVRGPAAGAGPPIVFDDLVRGEITFLPENLADYVLVRANGHPLYPLVNPVDDALMEITHVLRGEDLLPSTPRQIALYEALADIGVGSGRTPKFGHLPFVMGEGNKKLSKRDPGSGLAEYMERGFLPEGLLNYLALLGWAIADDRDVFTMDEMMAAFDIRGSTRTRPGSTRRSARRSTRRTCGCCRRPTRRAAGAVPGHRGLVCRPAVV